MLQLKKGESRIWSCDFFKCFYGGFANDLVGRKCVGGSRRRMDGGRGKQKTSVRKEMDDGGKRDRET